jgi:hypothetical protein
MRKQYHLRHSDRGLLAWDVHRLIELTSTLSPIDLPLSDIKELDEPFWFGSEGDVPTCRRIAGHAKLIEETDLNYPIIVDPENRVMDGMHRVCKALNQDMKTIKAYRLPVLPEPDFTGVPMNELPYD